MINPHIKPLAEALAKVLNETLETGEAIMVLSHARQIIEKRGEQ